MCDREDCKEYPIYGVQPHKCGYRHGKGFIGGSESLPQSDWPENFIPESVTAEGEYPGTGIYVCPGCLEGKEYWEKRLAVLEEHL